MYFLNAGLITRLIGLFLAGIILFDGSAGHAKVRSDLSLRDRETAPVIMRDNVAVPMRDGAVLRALIALPAGGNGRWPVVLTMTPYQREGGWNLAKRFAREGFVFVAIDTRGRGDSDGQFSPWINDGADGYDAVEWAAIQPWSTGAVGMWGSSYGGANQWATAAQKPPHLKSIMPAAAGLPGYDFPMRRGIMRPYAATWAAYVSGKSGHQSFFGDLGYQTESYERIVRSNRAQAELDAEIGHPNTLYSEFVAHPRIDDYWRARQISIEQYRRIAIPILSITGQWDGAQGSALEHYRRHKAASPRAGHWLIVGPFDHGGTRFPRAEVGGVTVPTNGVLDMFALDIAWFDWTLRDGPVPSFLTDSFRYYVLGENAWRAATDLDSATVGQTRFFLGSKVLRAYRPARRLVRYRNDPADLSRLANGTWFSGEWLRWRKDVDLLGDTGLIYTTPPLEEPMTLAGFPVVTANLAIDSRDADFRVRLFELAPDGSSTWLGQDVIRARYRLSVEQENFPERGQFNRYVFDKLAFIARRVEVGHRLQLVIDSPQSVHDQRNYNAGGEVARETLHDAKPTDVTLEEGGANAAYLELPLAR